MRLAQTRQCDGQCCIDQPQFPDETGKCKFFEKGPGGYCKVFRDITLLEGGEVDKWLVTCKGYPQNLRAGRGTWNCCLQWRDK